MGSARIHWDLLSGPWCLKREHLPLSRIPVREGVRSAHSTAPKLSQLFPGLLQGQRQPGDDLLVAKMAPSKTSRIWVTWTEGGPPKRRWLMGRQHPLLATQLSWCS